MKPALDSAIDTKRSGVRSYAHRPRVGLLVGVLVALLLALLPSAAQAHHTDTWGLPGMNGVEKIWVTPDGYHATGSFFRQEATVTGTSFQADNVVLIFQCPAGVAPVDVVSSCQPLGTATTDGTGGFGPTKVVYSNMFVSQKKLGGGIQADPFGTLGDNVNFCRGNAEWHLQCSIVAATFDLTTRVPNSMAEDLICYEGGHPDKCVGSDDPPS